MVQNGLILPNPISYTVAQRKSTFLNLPYGHDGVLLWSFDHWDMEKSQVHNFHKQVIMTSSHKPPWDITHSASVCL